MSLSLSAAKQNKLLLSACAPVVLALTALCLLAGPLFAQQYTDNKADQVLHSNGRVNPSTLGLEMSIPLAAYPGRGVNVPVSLSYSSKVWRLQYNYTSGQVNAPGCDTINQPVYSENTASGWTSSLGFPYIEYTGKDDMFNSSGVPLDDADPPCTANSTGYMNAYIKRLTLHLPSGETHELRAGDSPVLYSPSSNCPNSPCDPGQVNLQANWDTTYYAVDGSNVMYKEDSTTGTYRVLMPDGSHYDLSSSTTGLNGALIRKASTFTDRNGNYTTYHDPDATRPNGYWTDTLGRNIPIPLKPSAPTTAGDQTYQIPGFGGGGTVTYTLHWKKLKGATAADSGLTNFNQALRYYGDRYWSGTNWAVASPALFSSGSHHTQSSVINDLSMKVNTFNPIVLTGIDLPNGQSYKFGYNIYGEIERIDYPTGGEEQFVYSSYPTVSFQYSFYQQANRGVSDRKVYETPGQGTPYEWTYGVDTTGGVYKVNTTNPDSTRTERYLTKGTAGPPVCYPDPSQCVSGNFGYDNGLAGMPYDERSYNSLNQLVSKKLTTWAKTANAVAYSYATADWHPRVTQEESIIYDPATGVALSATTTTDYDGDLGQIATPVNPSIVKQYGFTTTVGSLGALQKSIVTTYLNDVNYTAVNLRSLPTQVQTKDGSGNVVAQSQLFYDESGYGSGGVRGQVTRTRSWFDIANNLYADTRAKYDAYGNLTEATDARGNVTTTTYSSTYNYAYPTSVTTAVPDPSGVNGSNAAFTSGTVYDFNTGLPTSTTDANGQTTTMEYNDPLLRPTKVTAPNGRQTVTEYGAGTDSTNRYVKVSTQIDATNWKVGYSSYDGLGRTIRTQSVDSAGDVFVDTEYDNMGRVKRTTNPYRSGDTIYWTTNTYDDLGRAIAVTTPDNAVVNTAYSLATTGSQIGTVVTVTDQAGKLRRSITNALGQLIRVDEPDGAGALGNIDTPNQATYYAYDTLNNLTTVTQGAQTRTFTYNSLSRLLSAANPESGTTSYGYDPNGNLTSKTDARSITTTYAYDALNRVKSRTYSDSTPAVTYYYDNLTNAKGKLIKVSSSVSTTEYTSFDTMGRVLAHKQTTDGTAYTTGYTYNLSGALIEETYPSGRKVRNTLNTNGDLSLVETQPSGGSYATRANNFTYTAVGAVSSMQLGNGRWESTQFNTRLQPTQIALGTTQNGTDQLKLNYDYGTTANNGNVQSQTITVPGMTYPLIQTYSYDTLNRLKSAEEKSNGTSTWKQTFLYDRYGNRNFDTANTTTLGSCSQQECNPTVSTSNNRFTSGQGYTYDLSGNVTLDSEGRQFTYDAENKQTQVKDVNNTTIGTYSYDGDGKRIKKVATTETTVFVYDALGRSVEEYSGGTIQTAYVYAGPRLLTTETATGTNYLTNDHLGSPRINTDGSGNVTARHDYMPFGEEIFAFGGRTASLGYNSDSVRKKFTGYERDSESGLDFAQARMFANSLGRFESPDPLLGSGDPHRPQSYNRYSYVGNNPLRLTDPTGLLWYSKTDANGTTSFRWYGEHDTIEDGYTLFTDSSYSLDDGSGKYVILNEDGPNKDGKTDFEKNGWMYSDTATSMGPTTLDPVQNPLSPHYDSMQGSEDVTLDLALAGEGAASIPGGLRAAGEFFARADIDAAAGALRTFDSSAFRIGSSRNLAVADFDIDGLGSGRVIAGSGPTQPGTVGVPDNPIFTPTSVNGWIRNSDSEYKLFEHLGGSIQDTNARGTVRMFTERKMCDSCAGVANQFRQRFPNVNVVVKNGNK